jgi:short-subunit dehydrogenase
MGERTSELNGNGAAPENAEQNGATWNDAAEKRPSDVRLDTSDDVTGSRGAGGPAGGNYGEEREMYELRGEIEETRTELSQTIDAIQAKLNPQVVKEKLTHDIQEATVGRAKHLAQEARTKIEEVAVPVLQNVASTVKETAQHARETVQDLSGKVRDNGTNNESSTQSNTPQRKSPLKPVGEQVVVIFGASSGIGRETAIQFARKGARVVVAARGEEGLDSLVEASAILVDRRLRFLLMSPVSSRLKPLPTAPSPSLAISIRGCIAPRCRCMPLSNRPHPKSSKQLIETNLVGQAYGAMAALPHLRREGRGALIHISSVEGKRAFPLQSAYGSSKHGVIGFLDSLRMELMHEGIPIFVTNVMPAGINTPLFNKARTKMGVKPMPAPPIYHPQVVAEVILHAAENPTRDTYAGGAAKMIATLQSFSPALMDKVFFNTGFKGQQTKEPKSEDAPDNLFSPVHGLDKVGGDFHDKAKPKSFNNWLETHPAPTT